MIAHHVDLKFTTVTESCGLRSVDVSQTVENLSSTLKNTVSVGSFKVNTPERFLLKVLLLVVSSE